MGMHRLPCDDPVIAARRAKEREKQARAASRRRARAPVQPPRVVGSVTFEPVVCPRCGDVFRGPRPLHSYACHRSTYCPWLDADEKAAHDALVAARAHIRSVEHRRRAHPPHPRVPARKKETYCEIPELHTGHELFDRARAARRSWSRSHTAMLAFPVWDDLLSEGVLALLEQRDPADAMQQFVHSQGPPMVSLYAVRADGLSLLDVLAA